MQGQGKGKGKGLNGRWLTRCALSKDCGALDRAGGQGIGECMAEERDFEVEALDDCEYFGSRGCLRYQHISLWDLENEDLFSGRMSRLGIDLGMLVFVYLLLRWSILESSHSKGIAVRNREKLFESSVAYA